MNHKRVTMPDGVTRAIQLVDKATWPMLQQPIKEAAKLNRQVVSMGWDLGGQRYGRRCAICDQEGCAKDH